MTIERPVLPASLRSPVPLRRSPRFLSAGMTLLEVVLALAVFSVAAVALVGTINQIGEAAFEAQQIRTIEQGIESLLDYYSKLPQITETEETVKVRRIASVTRSLSRRCGICRTRRAAGWRGSSGFM